MQRARVGCRGDLSSIWYSACSSPRPSRRGSRQETSPVPETRNARITHRPAIVELQQPAVPVSRGALHRVRASSFESGKSTIGKAEEQGKHWADVLLPVIKVGAVAAFLSHVVVQQQFAELCFGICLNSHGQQLLKLPGTFLLLVAACYHTLEDAAAHDRLKSATYQRISLNLVTWHVGVIGVFLSLPVTLGHSAYRVLIGAASLLCATVAWSAYTRAPGRSQPQAAKEAVVGFFSGLTSLVKAGGWNSSFWSAASIAQALYGAKLLLTQQGTGGPGSFLLGSASGDFPLLAVRMLGLDLLLAAALSFTVKDAVDRERINASTFQLLAKALAVTTLWNAVNLSGLGLHAASACATCNALFRGLQIVLAATGGLCLLNINVQKK